MSQLRRQSKFADELDSFLKHGQKDKSASTEYRELFKIGQMLADQDYSKHSDKEAVYRTLMHKNDTDKERKNMKINKPIWNNLTVSVASIAVIGGIALSVIQPSFASEVMGKILNTISLGHITISQTEPQAVDIERSIPEEMKDQISISNPGSQLPAVDKLIIRDTNHLRPYTMFDVLLPDYLPEGYKFDRAEFYKDEQDTVVDSKYIDIFFKNQETGEEIFMQQRHADQDTAYSGAFDMKIESIKVNGADAILIGDHGIDWEANGVLYSLLAKGLDRKEILNIAESIK